MIKKQNAKRNFKNLNIRIFNFFRISFLRLGNSQSGVAALFTIVVVAAATLVMAYTASLLGMGELDLGYTFQRGGEAFSLADGCLEEALYRIRRDSNYGLGAGDIPLDFSNGSCIINLTANNNQRIITVRGTVEDYNKKLEATITLSGNQIIIDSWQEKED